MSTPPNRASLLSSLRTGGVRSVSAQHPASALPTGSFPRSQTLANLVPPNTAVDAVDYADDLSERFAQSMRFPQTADPNAQANALRAQQQQMMLNMMGGMNGGMMNGGMTQEEMLFMARMQQQQMQQQQQQQQVQIEIMRLQALQQQAQAQATILALQQQQQAQQQRRFTPDQAQTASAGPLSNGTTFDSLRSAASSAAARRLSNSGGARPVDTVAEPMTAGLNGRFAARLNPNASVFRSSALARADEEGSPPKTAGWGSMPTSSSNGTAPSNGASTGTGTPTTRKSDAATSWRRGSLVSSGSSGSLSSQLSGTPQRKTSPSPPPLTPTVVVSRPDGLPASPPPVPPTPPTASSMSTRSGHRPSPLQLSKPSSPRARLLDSAPAPADTDEQQDSPPALSSSPTTSSPTSGSPTSSSHPSTAPSVREEASKRLYEGLGLGRPLATPTVPNPSASIAAGGAAAVLRQPRGPPSGAEDLGARNFASRIRRRAIGGLGALMESREAREGDVLAY